MLAAIGRGQLTVLADRVRARRANYDRYRAFFQGIDGICLLPESADGVFSNRWLTTILVDPAYRDQFVDVDSTPALVATPLPPLNFR